MECKPPPFSFEKKTVFKMAASCHFLNFVGIYIGLQKYFLQCLSVSKIWIIYISIRSPAIVKNDVKWRMAAILNFHAKTTSGRHWMPTLVKMSQTRAEIVVIWRLSARNMKFDFNLSGVTVNLFWLFEHLCQISWKSDLHFFVKKSDKRA